MRRSFAPQLQQRIGPPRIIDRRTPDRLKPQPLIESRSGRILLVDIDHQHWMQTDVRMEIVMSNRFENAASVKPDERPA